MKIGFDAKRLIYNLTGLGNYSRTLVGSLSEYYQENQYLLYTPGYKTNPRLKELEGRANIIIKTPNSIFERAFASYWRTFSLAREIDKDDLEIFHGLSNELPAGIAATKAKSIVTIHDLIFVRYPELYRWFDREIYARKSRYACTTAKVIVAVSEQTKRDIVEFLKVDPKRVEVIYQSCDPIFTKQVDVTIRENVRERYQLPSEFTLYVGSIEERKNLLGLVKAIKILSSKLELNLVALGNGGRYLSEVNRFVTENGMSKRVKILSGVRFADFPAIYQSASLFVYPSYFEGFGIPIIEALWSKVPVVSSTGSCFAEAGGAASMYVKPGDNEALADAIKRALEDSTLRETMITEGLEHVQQFSTQATSSRMIDLYRRVGMASGKKQAFRGFENG